MSSKRGIVYEAGVAQRVTPAVSQLQGETNAIHAPSLYE